MVCDVTGPNFPVPEIFLLCAEAWLVSAHNIRSQTAARATEAIRGESPRVFIAASLLVRDGGETKHFLQAKTTRTALTLCRLNARTIAVSESIGLTA